MDKIKYEKPIIPFVSIKPEGRSITVSWGLNIRINKEEGKYSCYIPSLDIYYTASNIDDHKRKANTLTKFFFNNFLSYGDKNGIKKLALELHKRGYKANNDVNTMVNLIRNKVIPSKFKNFNQEVPEEFSNSENQLLEANMAVAV